MPDHEPTEINPKNHDLWEDDPERAARLAYLDLLVLWDRQVREGEYRGVPCFHRDESRERPETRPKSPNYEPDSDAAVWIVPGKIRDRWKGAA